MKLFLRRLYPMYFFILFLLFNLGIVYAMDNENRFNSPLFCNNIFHHNNYEIVNEVLKEGPRLYSYNSSDSRFTFLHIANGTDTLKKLIAIQQNLNAVNQDDQTLLHIHASCVLVNEHNPMIVRYLLDAGASVNAVDKELNTPLHWAILPSSLADKPEQIETIRLLLNAQADLNATNVYGSTPLSLACAHFQSEETGEVIRCLIELQADVHYPIYFCLDDMDHPGSKQVVALIEDAAALHPQYVPQAKNIFYTLLKRIEHYKPVGDMVTIILLLKQCPSNKYDYLLNAAAEYDAPDYGQALLDIGVDPNKERGDGYTPLISACKHTSFSMVKLLLRHGGCVNGTPTSKVFLPLLIAIEKNQEKMVEYLLKKGANPNALNAAGRNALSSGSVNFNNNKSPVNQKITTLLVDYGATY